MRIRRPRFSRPRCFNGPGSSRRSSGSIIPARADQFNSIHERLIEAWKKLGDGRHLHLAGMTDNTEDAGTLAYLEDTARAGRPADHPDRYRGHRAGATTAASSISTIAPIELVVQALSLGMDVPRRLRRAARQGADALDRAAMEGDPVQQGHAAAVVGDVSGPSESAAGVFRGRSQTPRSSARPLCASRFIRARAPMSRWSARASRWSSNRGPMAAKASFARRLAPLPDFSGQYPVLGSWLVDHAPCGLSIREDENPITGNTSRFLPHAIL